LRNALVLCAVLGRVAWASPPPEDDGKDDKRNWKAASSDGAVVVTQKALGDKRCLLEAKRGERTLWTSKECAGTKLDFKFVSPDGERLAVIYPLPTIEGSVRSSIVMRMFRHGAQQYASAAAATTKDWSKLRTGGTSFYWLAGSLGASGEPPHYADDGRAFDFSTVDGRNHHVVLNE
jgi:hypothetical protein